MRFLPLILITLLAPVAGAKCPSGWVDGGDEFYCIHFPEFFIHNETQYPDVTETCKKLKFELKEDVGCKKPTILGTDCKPSKEPYSVVCQLPPGVVEISASYWKEMGILVTQPIVWLFGLMSIAFLVAHLQYLRHSNGLYQPYLAAVKVLSHKVDRAEMPAADLEEVIGLLGLDRVAWKQEKTDMMIEADPVAAVLKREKLSAPKLLIYGSQPKPKQTTSTMKTPTTTASKSQDPPAPEKKEKSKSKSKSKSKGKEPEKKEEDEKAPDATQKSKSVSKSKSKSQGKEPEKKEEEKKEEEKKDDEKKEEEKKTEEKKDEEKKDGSGGKKEDEKKQEEKKDGSGGKKSGSGPKKEEEKKETTEKKEDEKKDDAKTT
ncbi:unnamed protein product, partial [Mesorhabditis spiculigera]